MIQPAWQLAFSKSNEQQVLVLVAGRRGYTVMRTDRLTPVCEIAHAPTSDPIVRFA